MDVLCDDNAAKTGASQAEGRGPDCSLCAAAGFALCSRLDRKGFEELKGLATALHFPPETVIFEQGSAMRHLYIITQGMVRLYRLMPDGRRQVTGFMGPGDLLGGIKRNAGAYCTAESMTELDVCAFDRKTFSEFLQHNPDLCFDLLVVATDEIEAQYDQGILLGRRQASERVAAFLLLLARRARAQGGNQVVHIPMPRSDIADHLGLTIETVSRIFAQFKKQGLIEFHGPKTVVLKNVPALEDLGGLDDYHERRMMIGL